MTPMTCMRSCYVYLPPFVPGLLACTTRAQAATRVGTRGATRTALMAGTHPTGEGTKAATGEATRADISLGAAAEEAAATTSSGDVSTALQYACPLQQHACLVNSAATRTKSSFRTAG
jgi:hypothetical protein